MRASCSCISLCKFRPVAVSSSLRDFREPTTRDHHASLLPPSSRLASSHHHVRPPREPPAAFSSRVRPPPREPPTAVHHPQRCQHLRPPVSSRLHHAATKHTKMRSKSQPLEQNEATYTLNLNCAPQNS